MNVHESMDVSDHELLERLARDDPPAFESLRNELIAELIDSAPEECQRRLRGLQFRLDCIRRLTHTPLAALIKMQALMWESFLEMEQELQRLVQCFDGDAVSCQAAQQLKTDSSPLGQVIDLRIHLPNRHGYG